MEPINFTELYRRYAPDVFRFALYLSGNRQVAEDLVAETFFRAWTSPSKIRVATVKAYLLAITRNLHLNQRARTRHHEALNESLPDPTAPVETTLFRRAELEAVLRGLQRLPEIDRSALLMRALDGVSYEEIAAALGISTAAARVKVHRARARLSPIRGISKEKA